MKLDDALKRIVVQHLPDTVKTVYQSVLDYLVEYYQRKKGHGVDDKLDFFTMDYEGIVKRCATAFTDGLETLGFSPVVTSRDFYVHFTRVIQDPSLSTLRDWIERRFFPHVKEILLEDLFKFLAGAPDSVVPKLIERNLVPAKALADLESFKAKNPKVELVYKRFVLSEKLLNKASRMEELLKFKRPVENLQSLYFAYKIFEFFGWTSRIDGQRVRQFLERHQDQWTHFGAHVTLSNPSPVLCGAVLANAFDAQVDTSLPLLEQKKVLEVLVNEHSEPLSEDPFLVDNVLKLLDVLKIPLSPRLEVGLKKNQGFERLEEFEDEELSKLFKFVALLKRFSMLDEFPVEKKQKVLEILKEFEVEGGVYALFSDDDAPSPEACYAAFKVAQYLDALGLLDLGALLSYFLRSYEELVEHADFQVPQTLSEVWHTIRFFSELDNLPDEAFLSFLLDFLGVEVVKDVGDEVKELLPEKPVEADHGELVEDITRALAEVTSGTPPSASSAPPPPSAPPGASAAPSSGNGGPPAPKLPPSGSAPGAVAPPSGDVVTPDVPPRPARLATAGGGKIPVVDVPSPKPSSPPAAAPAGPKLPRVEVPTPAKPSAVATTASAPSQVESARVLSGGSAAGVPASVAPLSTLPAAGPSPAARPPTVDSQGAASVPPTKKASADLPRPDSLLKALRSPAPLSAEARRRLSVDLEPLLNPPEEVWTDLRAAWLQVACCRLLGLDAQRFAGEVEELLRRCWKGNGFGDPSSNSSEPINTCYAVAATRWLNLDPPYDPIQLKRELLGELVVTHPRNWRRAAFVALALYLLTEEEAPVVANPDVLAPFLQLGPEQLLEEGGVDSFFYLVTFLRAVGAEKNLTALREPFLEEVDRHVDFDGAVDRLATHAAFAALCAVQLDLLGVPRGRSLVDAVTGYLERDVEFFCAELEGLTRGGQSLLVHAVELEVLFWTLVTLYCLKGPGSDGTGPAAGVTCKACGAGFQVKPKFCNKCGTPFS
ncbi:MAG: hypothetical protein Kow0069_38510 [Promethearchaeota archaeon]